MTDFQPLGCGFGRTTLPSEIEAETVTTTEATDMAQETTSDKIVRLIGEAGGEISGADLRDQLGVDDTERRMSISALRKAGRVSSEGATVNIVYRLEDGSTPVVAGHRIPNPKKPAKPAKKPGKAKVKKATTALQVASDNRPALVPHPVTLQVELEATVVEDLQPIARQHLRRVLALALSRPGDIHDADWQALAAVAEGC